MSRRYYPGFFGALFLILLRTAIGWHFYYEGMEKVHAEEKTGRPWTAEPYLRASNGPFAANFRNLVPDVDSLAALDAAQLKARWDDLAQRTYTQYGFDEAQRTAAAASLEETKTRADAWFADPENADKVRKYRDEIEAINARERETLTYERERLSDRRKAQESTRRELVAVVDGWTKSLGDAWAKLAKEAQLKAGPPAPPKSDLDDVNFYTKWGLVVCGACLMLGLLTPIAALGGATLLALFYFSMPPWPGLPAPPNAEGHYLIVNKNAIEFLACLVLASTPNGLWLGLDALLFGWIGRIGGRREADEAGADEDTTPSRRY